MLTTLTAIGGLLPLAMQGSSLYSPLAWVIIGGLIGIVAGRPLSEAETGDTIRDLYGTLLFSEVAVDAVFRGSGVLRVASMQDMLDAARVLVDHGETWEDRGEKGWRRVVASPEPLDIIDKEIDVALRVGNLPENYGPDVLQPFNEKIVLEIQRALQFFTVAEISDRILVLYALTRRGAIELVIAVAVAIIYGLTGWYAIGRGRLSFDERLAQREVEMDGARAAASSCPETPAPPSSTRSTGASWPVSPSSSAFSSASSSVSAPGTRKPPATACTVTSPWGSSRFTTNRAPKM